MNAGQVCLRYTSQEYKYQKIIMVQQGERCPLTGSTIKELCDERMSRGFPHILALVRDEGKGQTIYSAAALSEIFPRGKRWEWKNPETNTKIKSIDFFAITVFTEGYSLIKKIKSKNDNAQAYEDLWFCCNLALASEVDNPHAFYSISSVYRHYEKNNQTTEALIWRKRCFQSIEIHYGRGIALLFLGSLVCKNDLPFLPNFLFLNLKYTFLNDLLVGSKFDKLVSTSKDVFLDVGKKDEYYQIIKKLFYETLQEKLNHPGAKFAEFLFTANDKGAYRYPDLEVFALSNHVEVAHLAQASLCTTGKTEYLTKYIDALTRSYPDWKLGQAMLNGFKLETNKKYEFLNNLNALSTDTNDFLILELLSMKYEELDVQSNVWGSLENIDMKILSISRNRKCAISGRYANALNNDGESTNALTLLQNNVDVFNNYDALSHLSNIQRELGLKNKDEKLYREGIRNGKTVFMHRDKHNRLTHLTGKDLVAEITPFKSTREEENNGLEILQENLKETNGKNIVIKKILGEYLIRKGTQLQAKEALQWIEELRKSYPKDDGLFISILRWKLRSAESKDDLLIAEILINEYEKSYILSKEFYLIKALWQSHPLSRDGKHEWFLLASNNFKKAFEGADTRDVKFLLDNLSRYDKLTEEDQIKCRTSILELLGIG